MKTCAVCGKEFEVLWPDLWRYRDGEGGNIRKWFCRYNCMMAYKRGKEAEKMYKKTKSDGTPAKKPGPRKAKKTEPKVELVYDPSIAEEYRKEQEAKKAEKIQMAPPMNPVVGIKISGSDGEMMNVEPVYMRDEENPIKPAQVKNVINGIEAENVAVTAIRTKAGEFYFDRKYGTIDWRTEIGEEISLTQAHWEELAEEIPRMLKMLGAED